MKIKFIDLFCGIGAFRVALNNVAKELNYTTECVFSSDIDQNCQKTYFANFNDLPFGDITKISIDQIPEHNLLFAGFPCQPFSIIGNGKGFEDTRGTLFFTIAQILKIKRPKAFVLENVKQLVSHRNGYTFTRIIETLKSLGYFVNYKVLNALDYGLPQKRERVFIVGYEKNIDFIWPQKILNYKPLDKILEKNVDEKYYASQAIQEKRNFKHTSKYQPAIWHENKAGNISSYPYSCALRAGASYNYLLVDGVRRLTPREMLRLQGFPDKYKIVVNDGQIRKQAGNSLPVNAAEAVLKKLLPFLINDLKENDNIKLGDYNDRPIYASTSYSFKGRAAVSVK